MRAVIASRIMRTTIDLDATVVKELKRRSKIAGKSMGQLASELLATSLRERAGRPRNPDGLEWLAKDPGRPLVDLEDKEAVRAPVYARRTAPPSTPTSSPTQVIPAISTTPKPFSSSRASR